MNKKEKEDVEVPEDLGLEFATPKRKYLEQMKEALQKSLWASEVDVAIVPKQLEFIDNQIEKEKEKLK